MSCCVPIPGIFALITRNFSFFKKSLRRPVPRLRGTRLALHHRHASAPNCTPSRQDMTRHAIRRGYRIIGLWMIWPLVPALLASLIAFVCGSKLDEGGAHPCIVFGTDIGEFLHVMGTMGLMAIGTFPSGILALIVFSLVIWVRKHLGYEDGGETEEDDDGEGRQAWIFWLGLASLPCSFLTAIPTLILAARARPLVTRAKVGAAVAMVSMVISVAASLLLKD
jgi:hypothetical protein